MRARLMIAGALALAGGASAQQARRPVAKPAATPDWAAAVTITPQGGFRQGNPDAPVKLAAATGVRGPVSAATEGLLSAMTAFRFGLQRVEARRRWLSAAVDGRGVAVPEGAGVNAASVEKFPCAVR